MTRRTARQAPARPARLKKQRFTLTVEGQPMLVEYTPNWMDGEFATGHFVYRSPHNPARRIPASETGYLSHFASMVDIEAADSPRDYACLVALSVIRRAPAAKISEAERVQPSLFSLIDQ